MGMACELLALTPGQMDAICDSYKLAHKVVFGDYDEDEDEDEDKDKDKDEDEREDEGPAKLAGEPLRERLYIDKCWGLLRFMLNKAGGQGDSKGDWTGDILFADMAGAITEIDAGYGFPPYLRSVEATREFADFLSTLTVEQLLSHWDTEEMLKDRVYLVYKEGDPARQEEADRDLRGYAASHFPDFRAYVMQAAAAGCGLLISIG